MKQENWLLHRLKRYWVVGFLVLAATAIIWLAIPPDLSEAQPSPQLLAANGRLLNAQLTSRGTWRLETDCNKVDPIFLQMLIAYEDRHFYIHPGVNPLSLLRATWQWTRTGKVVSGGSTLTMQTVRLLHPRPRTISSKLIEIAEAVRLEMHLSKNDILNLYLRLAPYGGNIEGVRTASLLWFGREPDHMSIAEAALLVAFPQDPNNMRPDYFPQNAYNGRNKILLRMEQNGVITPQQRKEADITRLPISIRPLPRLAPHFAQIEFAQGHSITSTIDYDLQNRLENLLRQEIENFPSPMNLAVIIQNNDSGEAIAYSGSADSLDKARFGANNMAKALRSPGSALKPFIYGLAFTDGWLRPDTILLDRAVQYGDYTPVNFYQDYTGEVRATEALQQSLNTPVVQILERYGAARAFAVLRNSGVELEYSGRGAAPGLPLALGGVGISLRDLTKLYGCLAREGLCPSQSYRLLSPKAARQVNSILLQAPLPPGIAEVPERRFAFKTGTSYGFRDSLAIGYDYNYTVGVWAGRADGNPNPGQFGRISAAPLLWKVYSFLPQTSHPLPQEGILHVLDISSKYTAPSNPKLRIAYPLSEMTLDYESSRPGIPLEATGGKPPYQWIVNDMPIPSDKSSTPNWIPRGPGAASIGLIDSVGNYASAQIWIGATP